MLNNFSAKKHNDFVSFFNYFIPFEVKTITLLEHCQAFIKKNDHFYKYD